ncbi:hypothetical protein BJ741DRAFT_444506 [Chytriomyces cf. hyalinus JEL632]|nr:hypothetical protein BJ741DRAFT_444506 [Chytriomyces cf. hyalinus JEL632]
MSIPFISFFASFLPFKQFFLSLNLPSSAINFSRSNASFDSSSSSFLFLTLHLQLQVQLQQQVLLWLHQVTAVS